ncbi:hypothetical protein ACLOJK_013332 [Asimina triloba]
MVVAVGRASPDSDTAPAVEEFTKQQSCRIRVHGDQGFQMSSAGLVSGWAEEEESKGAGVNGTGEVGFSLSIGVNIDD